MVSVSKTANHNSRRRDASHALVTSEPAGWVTRSAPYPSANGQRPLEVHRDWLGPHKLVARGHECRHVAELLVNHAVEDDGLVDDEEPGGRQPLVQRLVDGPLSADPQETLDDWQPPRAADLERHLRASGYEPTVDEEQNLRLTIKSRGSVGQVVIRRPAGRLQLDMPLGQWNGLDAVRKEAMLQIAGCQNDRVRLVRITWDADDSSCRCAARVDLSGLPLEPEYTWLWSDMLRVAVGGLELALHQLGKELDVLADARHEHIARWLVATKPVADTALG